MNLPNSRNTLLVSGLSNRVTVDALMGHFCQWGHVSRVYLAGAPDAAFAASLLAGAAAHSALVVFTDPTSVDAALQSPGPHCLHDRSYRIERYRCPEAPASPTDGSPESQLAALLDRCNQLQVENQQLASLIPAKDKAARLLLGNVEAWRQKLVWVEKKRIEDLNRLQANVAERQRSVEQLNAAAIGLRQQLEEQRAADLAAGTRSRWQALLERENAALLAVMHDKSKDLAAMQQLVATLNAARQELSNQQMENSRLNELLNQRNSQFSRLTEQLDEVNSALNRLAREGGGQQQQLVQSLTAERDRLRAQLHEAVTGGGGGGSGSKKDAVADSSGKTIEAEAEVDAKNDDENVVKVDSADRNASSDGPENIASDKLVDQDGIKAGDCGGGGGGGGENAEENEAAAAEPAARTPLGSLSAAQQLQQ